MKNQKKKKMSLQPRGYRVIVKPDSSESVSSGGIVILEDKIYQEYGTLVAIGELAWRESNIKAGYDVNHKWFNVGDRVIYSRFGGKWFKDESTGTEYIVMNDEDILALVT